MTDGGFVDKAGQLRALTERTVHSFGNTEMAVASLQEVEAQLADLKNNIISVAGFEGEHIFTMLGTIDRANDILLTNVQGLTNLMATLVEVGESINAAADYYGR